MQVWLIRHHDDVWHIIFRRLVSGVNLGPGIPNSPSTDEEE